MTATDTGAAEASGYAESIAKRLAAAKRVVIKIGTSVLLRDDGSVALGPLASVIDSIATLRRTGLDVLLVSSGAIGLGAERLALGTRPSTAAMKRACAAIGQSRLMGVYEDGFARLGLAAAQLLLTDDDLADVRRRNGLRAAVDALFRANVVPVANENDTVSVRYAERHNASSDTVDHRPSAPRAFHDNDMLAALMACTIDASVLLLLSDVDGLHTANPRAHATASPIPTVATITSEIEAMASGTGVHGRGGMAGKVAAARTATESGILTIIANGRRHGVVDELWAGTSIGTAFLPRPIHNPIKAAL